VDLQLCDIGFWPANGRPDQPFLHEQSPVLGGRLDGLQTKPPYRNAALRYSLARLFTLPPWWTAYRGEQRRRNQIVRELSAYTPRELAELGFTAPTLRPSSAARTAGKRGGSGHWAA
jgi:hypothetical protein